MSYREQDQTQFIYDNYPLVQKAKRLRYKYGDQKPFNKDEMNRVLQLLEIMWEREMNNDTV